ncbi:ribose-phosphate diphosphokinase [Hyperthermus butylicus]|uniref:ribose-phosphate diphosphokinase n=1 Tax=Hyperthermus butylicus TaxID=54248 RepID=UPI001E394393|nr:ribose-phosphate diphosphokinase [Hyperthermus butylicus]
MAGGAVVVRVGPVPESFASGLAEGLGARLVEGFVKVFPDGEVYVRLPGEVEGSTAVIVFTGYPEPTQRLWEAVLAVEAARGLGAEHVVVVAAYTPYARQDRRFLRGEPVSVRALFYSLAASGAEAFVTVDIHKTVSLQWFPGPAVNVDPAPAFAEKLRPLLEGREKVYVIAPDQGAVGRAKSLAERLGAPFDYLEKVRDRVTGEIVLRPKLVDVSGAAVVLIDDIVSTGGTMAKAARMLYEQGAEVVIAAATHGLFAGEALEKMRKAGIVHILVADTVKAPEDVDVASVGRLAADAVKSVLEAVAGYESEG